MSAAVARRRILAIETSCDETAAAVVDDGRIVRSNVILTQIAKHAPFGGVVPEIASRAHLEAIGPVIREALERAGGGWDSIDAIAVTRGPGLAPALLVGVSAAKGLALALGKPLVPVHHLEGHVWSVFLADPGPDPARDCPMLLMMVSGGHTQLIHMTAPGQHEIVGRTMDDAAGEALDKGAKLLGLGYPGGPAIEQAAAGGDPEAIAFPRGFRHHAAADRSALPLKFSFSGLKTALLYHLKANPGDARPPRLADVCASYQEAVIDALLTQLDHGIRALGVKSFACVGGVARNRRLRARLDELSRRHGIPLHLTPMDYCTDNAAMIAAAAAARPHAEGPDFDVTPSWPL